MTYEEAAREWNKYIGCQEKGKNKECNFDCDKCDDVMGISPDLVRASIEALEKQIPKKPAYAFIDGFTLSVPSYCPVCGEQIAKYDAYARCVLKEHHCRCGQAIDWSEVE